MKPHFKVGDKVYRNYPFDGTPKQGHPDTKRVFTITKIDHFEPVDGVKVLNCVCVGLSQGCRGRSRNI
jgi:hypothetical protein